MKTCTKCGEVKPLSEFYKDKRTPDGTRSYCALCSKVYREANKGYAKIYYAANKSKILTRCKVYKNKNKQKDRARKLQKRYSINPEDYESLFIFQGGVCAICGGDNKGRALHVDHAHETQKVRGLLCRNCNTGLGLMKDSEKILTKAVYYLIMNSQLLGRYLNA